MLLCGAARSGSRNERVVGPYIAAVRAFLGTFPQPPNVVDLGCGDFAVGARLRSACAGYIGCDVVPALVERNRRLFSHLNVDFCCSDVVASALPPGDVVFLRQVLQHLDNRQIASVLRKIPQYPWAVITEHVPAAERFRANVDKPIGPGTRLRLGSGLVVTQSPFDLAPVEERLLCEVKSEGALIRTVAYKLSSRSAY